MVDQNVWMAWWDVTEKTNTSSEKHVFRSRVGTSVILFLQILDLAVDSVICLWCECIFSVEMHVDVFTIRSIVVDAA